jgi:ribosomal protein S18 acetylase RimI-like enzyme
MSETVSFVIRDGHRSDIADCLNLDHTYETDYVWQMQINNEEGWRIDFKTERLPRALTVTYPASEERLHASTAPDQCFLVATTRDNPQVIGYLVMRADPLYHIGQVQDVVVSPSFRRQKLGTRLTKIALRWAREQHLTSLMIETQTKNLPGIRFCEAAGFTFCGFNDRYFPNRDIAVFFSQSVR